MTRYHPRFIPEIFKRFLFKISYSKFTGRIEREIFKRNGRRRQPDSFHHHLKLNLLFNRNVIVGGWFRRREAKLEFAAVFISVPATSRLFFNIRSISVSFETTISLRHDARKIRGKIKGRTKTSERLAR